MLKQLCRLRGSLEQLTPLRGKRNGTANQGSRNQYADAATASCGCLLVVGHRAQYYVPLSLLAAAVPAVHPLS